MTKFKNLNHILEKKQHIRKQYLQVRETNGK